MTIRTLTDCMTRNGEEGFDVRHSRGGSWGFANYFAANADYSDKYAHRTPQGEKELFAVS